MKLICIADTHNKHEEINLPKGDILIHAGDFTDAGTLRECKSFLKWFSSQPHKYKILIGGNHDFYLEKMSEEELNSLIPINIHYLNNSGISIGELNIWGSPITPGGGNWAFRKARGTEIAEYWNSIPTDTNILITHTPPYGIMDRLKDKSHIGCEELKKKLTSLNLQFHIFGHLHENYGFVRTNGIQFINCSIVDNRYRTIHPPISIDIK